MGYIESVRARLGAEFHNNRGEIGFRRLANKTGIPTNTVASFETGVAALTLARARKLAEAADKGSATRLLPLLRHKPTARERREARDAVEDIGLDVVIAVAHAAGVPAATLLSV